MHEADDAQMSSTWRSMWNDTRQVPPSAVPVPIVAVRWLMHMTDPAPGSPPQTGHLRWGARKQPVLTGQEGLEAALTERPIMLSAHRIADPCSTLHGAHHLLLVDTIAWAHSIRSDAAATSIAAQ